MGRVVTSSDPHLPYPTRLPLQSRAARFPRPTPPLPFRRREIPSTRSSQPLPTKFDAFHDPRDRRRARYHASPTTTFAHQSDDPTSHFSRSRQPHFLLLITTSSSSSTTQKLDDSGSGRREERIFYLSIAKGFRFHSPLISLLHSHHDSVPPHHLYHSHPLAVAYPAFIPSSHLVESLSHCSTETKASSSHIPSRATSSLGLVRSDWR